MSAVNTGGPYQTPAEAVVDNVLFQVFYRQLGVVSVNFGTGDVYQAAQYLAAHGRGGSVSWVETGRLAQWDGLYVTPGVSGSPAIDVWMFGSKGLQHNTVLLRKGFWSFDLFPRVTAARLALTTRIVAAVPHPASA